LKKVLASAGFKGFLPLPASVNDCAS